MAKSLFGGSAALTGALLLGSLIFYAHPSIAEDLGQIKQEQKTQSRTENAGASLPADAAPLVEVGSDMKLPATVRVEVEDGPPPEVNKATAANVAPAMNVASATAPQLFTATAYSLRGRTASGQVVTRGLIAADRRVFPLGTRVRLEAGSYSGEYLVADRGGAVRGRKIDIWMPTSHEARRFGRRPVKLTVLSYGGTRRPRT